MSNKGSRLSFRARSVRIPTFSSGVVAREGAPAGKALVRFGE